MCSCRFVVSVGVGEFRIPLSCSLEESPLQDDLQMSLSQSLFAFICKLTFHCEVMSSLANMPNISQLVRITAES